MSRRDALLERPQPPHHLVGGIGDGDFWQVGNQVAGLTMALAGLHPNDRVLDVGCGLGRVAWPLSRLLGPSGNYDGFDTSAEYIKWCQQELGLPPERFRFWRFDIRNSHYNPDGKILAEEFVLPWPDGAFTLVIASSLFTHLSTAATGNYLSQIGRTLDQSGRLFGSFFVLDKDARKLVQEKTTCPAFSTEFPEGMFENSGSPDAAVAFDADWLAGAIASAGLTFEAFYPGRWRQIAAVAHQDIIIARKTVRTAPDTRLGAVSEELAGVRGESVFETAEIIERNGAYAFANPLDGKFLYRR